jgi:hypothetical protein
MIDNLYLQVVKFIIIILNFNISNFILYQKGHATLRIRILRKPN